MTSLYNTRSWRELRQVALERDGYRCRVCGVDVSGKGQARVDHIIPVRVNPSLGLVLENLRTLCTVCDSQSHRERSRGGGGPRVQRFTPLGAGADGWPLRRRGS